MQCAARAGRSGTRGHSPVKPSAPSRARTEASALGLTSASAPPAGEGSTVMWVSQLVLPTYPGAFPRPLSQPLPLFGN